MAIEGKREIRCHECAYFVTTWNPNFPRACRLYGFKGKQWPSDLVINSTGEPCLGFTKKAKKMPESKRTPTAKRRQI